ncbi:hypothetical protein B0H16DRAFT_1466190 [Mycena metata]|uniref:F-box domain-containing protein n=1 Tax=Mycena metata TaxID=1033252 RepID=A0AAD7MXN9_9AGAR|nr:hypothetical protein B0H16DRAFT_1466190 [Mycena metata]
MATTSESVVSALSPSQERLIRDTLRSHYELPAGQIASLLSSLSDQLSKCDEEVAKLERRITEINAHRAVLLGQYHDCKALLAPARRLPPEILGEIFALTSDSASTSASANGNFNYAASLERIANSSILALSQVCARWHDIALGTPALWSKVELDAVLWPSPDTAKNAMSLLQVFLSRGGNVPLSILITNNTDMPFHGPALQLLAQHSLRWRSATFKCPMADLRHLAPVNGNLPILETLEIIHLGEGAETLSLFEVAPRLRHFTVGATLLGRVSTPPVHQLSQIGLVDLASTDLPSTVSTMAHMSDTNSFCMRFYLDDWISSRSNALRLDIPHTSSDVGRLSIELVGEFYRHHCQQALAAIFTGLTLSSLQALTFRSNEYPHFPILWSQPQFLALGARSGFEGHLHSLDLFHVQITETQLLQCLSVLPALMHLAVADHERARGRGANLVVISDSLLEALTRTPDAPCLVPHLESLHIRSRLRFTDDVYLAMVVSRLEPGGRRFKSLVEMLPQGVDCRHFDPGAVTRLRELVACGDLEMSLPASW